MGSGLMPPKSGSWLPLSVVTLHVVPASNSSKQPAPTPNKASWANRSRDLATKRKSTSRFKAAKCAGRTSLSTMRLVLRPSERALALMLLRSSSASTDWEVWDSHEASLFDFGLKPLKIGGLWLAVIITPPIALSRLTAKETEGVGVGCGVK